MVLLVVVFYNVGFRVLLAAGLMQFSALFPDDFALAKTFLCREGKLGLDSLRCTNWMIVFPTHTTLLNAMVASVFLKEQKAKKATNAKIPLRVIPDFAFTTESAFISKSSI